MAPRAQAMRPFTSDVIIAQIHANACDVNHSENEGRPAKSVLDAVRSDDPLVFRSSPFHSINWAARNSIEWGILRSIALAAAQIRILAAREMNRHSITSSVRA